MAASTAPNAAPPRRLLDLNGEMLAAIFALAQREADEAHVAAYRVHAPQRMPLVCRMLRQLHKGKKRVLLVPLLRADGVTPTFFDKDQWATYLRAVKLRGDDDLRLVSSAPFDAGAHLACLGLVAPRPISPFLYDDVGAFTVDVDSHAHVKHCSCSWSLARCAKALIDLNLLVRVTAMHLRLCLPLALPAGELVDLDSPSNHFAGVALHADLTQTIASAKSLRSMTVSIGALEAGPPSNAAQLRRAQHTLVAEAWNPIATALRYRRTPSMELLRFEVEAPVQRVDGFILDFILRSTMALVGPHPFHRRFGDDDTAWYTYLDLEAPEVVPTKVRCVQLAHVGSWHETQAVHMLALMGVERLELLGDGVFCAFVDCLSEDDLGYAALHRTAPSMTLQCASVLNAAAGPTPWLHVVGQAR